VTKSSACDGQPIEAMANIAVMAHGISRVFPALSSQAGCRSLSRTIIGAEGFVSEPFLFFCKIDRHGVSDRIARSAFYPTYKSSEKNPCG
jgi:hypothetical protein